MADIPEGLGLAGAALWADVVNGRTLTAANKVLLLSACRLADNLDRLTDEMPSRSMVTTNHLDTESIHPTVSEFRQQASALQTILSKMGIAELPKTAREGKTTRDQLAERRAKREAG